jgi:GNAT superfamily N-acetyltransferase
MTHLELALRADLIVLLPMHMRAFAVDVAQYGQGPPGYNRLEWHKEMLDQAIYYKIQHQGRIVGGIIVRERSAEHYYLDTLFVDPEFHNSGIGTQAMIVLEHMFPMIQLWSLHTPYQSYRNHHFYEKLGYRKVGQTDPTEHPGAVEGFCLWLYEKRIVAR